MARRGYFGVVLYHPRKKSNIGNVLRNCHAFGAQFIAIIGERYRRESTDTSDVKRSIPMFYYPTFEDFERSLPDECPVICIERHETATSLETFPHLERTVYMFGPEAGNIPKEILNKHRILQIQTNICLNLGTCSGIVLYDRHQKLTK